MDQFPEDVRESLRANVTPTDEADVADLNETPEDLHADILDQLDDLPPKHWADINEELVDQREEEAEETQEEYRETVIEDGLTYLEENHSVTVD
jgi:hypothetical protein